ncbi:MAG: MFS transporter small subunit [Niveispirillum sp.]|uniref:MFS transporter small subunit n=1 Tax=Niveispirillum sp. TaxID=1917217 RepID=UPI003BA40DE1
MNYIHEGQIAAGVSRAQVHDYTMYILAGVLVLGFVANALVTPVDRNWFTKDEGAAPVMAVAATSRSDVGRGRLDAKVLLAWLAVGIPIAFGVYQSSEAVRLTAEPSKHPVQTVMGPFASLTSRFHAVCVEVSAISPAPKPPRE